jgi:transcriptional regulator with XRE-family HTH domain
MTSFSTQFSSWRIKKGLSQTELARKANIPRPNLINLESGKRDCNLATLYKLAQALQISPGTLLDQNPHPIKKFNRHQIDQIARAIIHPSTKLSSRLETSRNEIYPLLFPTLRAVGIHKIPFRKSPSRRIKSRVESIYGRDNVTHIIKRVNKLLANQ